MTTRKLAMLLAGASAALLVAMLGVSLATGVSQEAHEWYRPVAEYTRDLVANPGALRLLFGLDVAFLVLYTAFFVALADFLRKLGRPFVGLALAALLGTAMLDVIEDHHIVTMLDMALLGQMPSEAQIAFEQVLSSTKFTLSYVALVLFGLAIPRERALSIALVVFLTVGTLLTAVVANATGPELRESNAIGRWVGFMVGFALIVAWLRSQRDPEPAVSPAAGS